MPPFLSPSPLGSLQNGDEKDGDYTFHFHFDSASRVVELNASKQKALSFNIDVHGISATLPSITCAFRSLSSGRKWEKLFY